MRRLEVFGQPDYVFIKLGNCQPGLLRRMLILRISPVNRKTGEESVLSVQGS